MQLDAVLSAVHAHCGTFLCERISEPELTREVSFRHRVTTPESGVDVPAVGRLDEAYRSFGSVLFYHHEASGDAARYLAPPSEWPRLADELAGWLEMLDDDELDELFPHGRDGFVVIGETPGSGNYILVPTAGSMAGHVIEFDHDGFELSAVAGDMVQYIAAMLAPDAGRLTDFASHMRFIEGSSMEQWWIREMRDNAGNRVTTSE